MNNYKKMLEGFKSGKIAVVFDDEKRENEADLIVAIDNCTVESVNLMITEGKGLLCATLSPEIAGAKGFPLMPSSNTDVFSTAFTLSIDSRKVKTGISPFERWVTAKELVNKDTTLKDFITPGHLFPLIARHGGVLARKGHTEASVSLCRQAGLNQAALICEMIKPDGSMYSRKDSKDFAEKNGLVFTTIKEVVEYEKLTVKNVEKVSSAKLKTEYGEFNITVYKELFTDKEHVFLSMGDFRNGPVRIHSECFTGDVLFSKSCDCRSQLHDSLTRISKEQKGAVVYLRQEGRGIGLGQKIKAYDLQQNQQLDTVDANLKLGFEADERDFHQASWILKDNGFENVKLLSNNPYKKECLEKHGFKVERIVTDICINPDNAKYLHTKKDRLGHDLDLS